MVMDPGAGAGLQPLLDDLAVALGVSPRDVLGTPVALALRHEISDDRLFLSGVPEDLLALVAAAFGAAVADDGRIRIAARRWIDDGAVVVGSGPVQARPDDADGARVEGLRRVDVGARTSDGATRLEAATALRAALRATSERLAADLSQPPDFKQIAELAERRAASVRAVAADVAASRDSVGRYLLDAGDYFDDERIDQLGDGYVRVAALWSAFATGHDPDLGEAILAIEHDCAGWMRGAAEPPTRYAF
jgi:hypothetical protein